jgi:hypothetical protein
VEKVKVAEYFPKALYVYTDMVLEIMNEVEKWWRCPLTGNGMKA